MVCERVVSVLEEARRSRAGTASWSSSDARPQSLVAVAVSLSR